MRVGNADVGVERKALEQILVDDEDEDEDEDSRYLNLEGDDDGETPCFWCVLV